MKTLLITLAVMGIVACATPAQVPPGDAEHIAATTPRETPPGDGGLTASAVAAAAETSQAQAQESPDDEICRTQKVTGSRFIRRVCHTRAEWKQMELAAAETMRDIESQPRPIRQ